MIRILTHTPLKQDSTSFYRAYGVFHNLNRRFDGKIQFTDYQRETLRGSFTWADLAGFDILFLQRPYMAQLFDMAHYAKSLGVKIWVDFDDNLFELTDDHPSYFQYKDMAVKKVMGSCMQLAHQVTVSTDALADYFRKIGIKSPITVVPNALNTDWFTMAENFNHDSNVIAWRGSSTHNFDLLGFSDAMVKAIHADKTKVWHFMGQSPSIVARNVEAGRVFVSEGEDPILYHKRIAELRPKILHVPLIDTALNRSKSNIAWLEATLAGAVCVAPDWPEWQRPGVITYKSIDEYTGILSSLPSDDILAQKWIESREFIEKYRTLNYINSDRELIVRNLLAKSPDYERKTTMEISKTMI